MRDAWGRRQITSAAEFAELLSKMPKALRVAALEAADAQEHWDSGEGTEEEADMRRNRANARLRKLCETTERNLLDKIEALRSQIDVLDQFRGAWLNPPVRIRNCVHHGHFAESRGQMWCPACDGTNSNRFIRRSTK